MNWNFVGDWLGSLGGVALAGFAGAAIGTLAPRVFDYWLQGRRDADAQRRERLARALVDLYTPFYQKLILLPSVSPDHYFREWDDDELSEWLSAAVEMLADKVDLLPDNIVERLGEFRERSASGYDAEEDVRWLYKEMKQGFMRTRRELGVK